MWKNLEISRSRAKLSVAKLNTPKQFYQTSKALISRIIVNNVELQVEIDTGATISLMHVTNFRKLFPKLKLKQTNVQLSRVSAPVKVLGACEVQVSSLEGKKHALELYVCESYKTFTTLLGRDWLDVLSPEWRSRLWPDPSTKTPEILAVDVDEAKFGNQLKTQFSKVFTVDGTQTIHGFEAKIILKDNAVPVFQKPYPVPFAMRSILEEKYDALVKEKKIYPVTHSEWASPVVSVKKADGTYRTCVSFKKTVNPQIKIDQYPFPIPEETYVELANGAVFVTLDLADAYTQLAIAPESAPLLTMNTHKGLFRYTRLIYGIASAAAIFQKTMEQILVGIPDVYVYIDDVIIKGKTVTACKETTMRVLERFDKHNVRLKIAKCSFLKTSVEYLGLIISNGTRSTSPKKVAAILNAKVPRSKKEVQSFLGMVNFYSPFFT